MDRRVHMDGRTLHRTPPSRRRVASGRNPNVFKTKRAKCFFLSPSLLVSFPFDELILPPVRFYNRALIFSYASSLCIVSTASSPFDAFESQGIRLYLSIHRLRGFFQTTVGKLADLRDDDYAIMLFIATMDMYNRLLNIVVLAKREAK